MLRSPALRFVILGALLYAARGLVGDSTPAQGREVASASIVVDADDLERMRRSYTESVGGLPDKAAYDYMIERFVEDELLYREALTLGLHRGDDTIRWRLIEKMRYLGEAEEVDPDEDVFQRALRLGLERDDPIIKSVLIDKYRMLVRYAYGARPTTEAELRGYYERNQKRFADPPRVTFAHVFFSAQARGEDARADAEAALSVLRRGPMPEAEAIGLGDAFRPGHRVTHQTSQGIARLFGGEFASTVLSVGPGEWAGPFSSAYGQHLVLVTSRHDGGARTFESVRSQVAKAVAAERREERLRAKLAELRKRYDVVIRDDRMVRDGDA